jgi:hypothetical protein
MKKADIILAACVIVVVALGVWVLLTNTGPMATTTGGL